MILFKLVDSYPIAFKFAQYNVASIQKSHCDKSHRVIVSLLWLKCKPVWKEKMFEKTFVQKNWRKRYLDTIIPYYLTIFNFIDQHFDHRCTIQVYDAF